MKKIKKHLVTILMGLMLCLSLTACDSVASDKAYPLGLDGTEILVGETTLSALYDAGYTIMALDSASSGRFELEPSYQLEKDSYYSGLFIEKDDKTLAMLQVVTDSKEVPASEAVIAFLSFAGYNDEPLDTDMITFDGVVLTDLNAEVFMEHVPGGEAREDGSGAYFYGSNYSVSIEYENGVPVEFEVAREYDVDRY